jgi:hypothetical protein
MALLRIEASNGLFNNSGSTVIISILIGDEVLFISAYFLAQK